MNYLLTNEHVTAGYPPDQFVGVWVHAEDGRQFMELVGEFGNRHTVKTPDVLAAKLKEFIGSDTNPFFYCKAEDYEWAIFCQVFTTTMPESFPLYLRDISLWCDEHGKPKLPNQLAGHRQRLSPSASPRAAWDFFHEANTGYRS